MNWTLEIMQPGITILLAQCYQTSGERAKVIGVLEPLQHKKFVWWNLTFRFGIRLIRQI